MNAAQISEIVGSGFKVNNIRGNFRIDIANLKNTDDEQRLHMVTEALAALRAKGIECTYKACFPSNKKDTDGDTVWVPWTHIWVNTREQASAVATDRIDKIENTLSTLVAMMAKMAGVEEEVEETSEDSEPDVPVESATEDALF